jgi:hypothetical protein
MAQEIPRLQWPKELETCKEQILCKREKHLKKYRCEITPIGQTQLNAYLQEIDDDLKKMKQTAAVFAENYPPAFFADEFFHTVISLHNRAIIDFNNNQMPEPIERLVDCIEKSLDPIKKITLVLHRVFPHLKQAKVIYKNGEGKKVVTYNSNPLELSPEEMKEIDESIEPLKKKIIDQKVLSENTLKPVLSYLKIYCYISILEKEISFEKFEKYVLRKLFRSVLADPRLPANKSPSYQNLALGRIRSRS